MEAYSVCANHYRYQLLRFSAIHFWNQTKSESTRQSQTNPWEERKSLASCLI